MRFDYPITALMEAASFVPGSIQSPDSWMGHLPFAAWLITQTTPTRFVELGTHSGNSYFSFCQAVKARGLPTRCYAVDTWAGDEHAGYYGDDVYNYVATHNQKHYEQFSRLLKMTFDEAVDYFSESSIDLLHIDGLHTYEAVKHDFETWLPKLTPGAVVLFHDINVRERGFGVWKLWEELTTQYPQHFEFSHSHGLGVIQIPGADEDKKLELFSLSAEEKHLIQTYFASLGQTVQEKYHIESQSQNLSQLVQTLNSGLSARDENIERLTAELSARDENIVRLKGELSERDGQNQQLDELVQNLSGNVSQLQSQLHSVNVIVSELMSSTSWRITAPLRKIKTTSHNITSFGEVVNNAVKLGGGFKATLRKAINLYRQEGLKGIRRGIQFVSARSSNDYVDRNNYAEWLARYDTLTEEKRQKIRGRIDVLTIKPLISIVMPVYNANSKWLAEAIESVQNQLYPNWELCIADDKSTDPAVRTLLEKYAQEDNRIKLIFRQENGHISAASNSALTLATGEWIALMDQDDLLPEHALFWVIDALQSNPDAKLIYSDEDKVDESGKRHNPYFKCDWNRDLFYSQNMISHLGVYHHQIIKKIGGFRVGFEGSQDHDLALRYIEHIRDEQIHHIPRVLYHWRVHTESTAGGADAKPYAAIAGEKALNEHFIRTGRKATATSTNCGYRVCYQLPSPQLRVSLIIPTRNSLELIRTCVESILDKTRYDNYEILIIDNGSDDPDCLEYFKQLEDDYPQVNVIRDERPFNYSALNNNAVHHATGEIVGLLNNDIEVIEPDWLTEMVSLAIQPGIGAVGAKLLYPDNRVQHAGVVMGLHTLAGHIYKGFDQNDNGYFARANVINGYSAVTAACLLVSKQHFDSVNGLNETDLTVAFNDVDFCLKLKEQGLRNVFTPYALLYHHESATRGAEDNPEKIARFEKEIAYMHERWPDYIDHDPCYSPNLTLEHEDCSLAWPPRIEII